MSLSSYESKIQGYQFDSASGTKLLLAYFEISEGPKAKDWAQITLRSEMHSNGFNIEASRLSEKSRKLKSTVLSMIYRVYLHPNSLYCHW